MEKWSYMNKTKYIYSSVGIMDDLLNLIEDEQSILVVSGKKTLDRIGFKTEIRNRGIEGLFEYVEGIEAEPKADKVYEGIDIVKKRGIQLVLGVGGGSVIDTAKAIGIGSEVDFDFFNFFESKAVPVATKRVGVVLTCFGAGSEGSNGAVITKGERKLSCGAELMRVTFALCSSEMIKTMPQYQVRCALFDMFSHCFERYFTQVGGNGVSSSMLLSLMKIVIEYIDRGKLANLLENDLLNLAYASRLCHDDGLAFRIKGDWATHTIAHEIGAVTGLKHAETLSCVMPAWAEVTLEHDDMRGKRLLKEVFNWTPVEDVGKNLAISVKDIVNTLELTSVWDKCGNLGKESIDRIVDGACSTTISGTVGNYRRLKREEVRRIVEKACSS